MKKLNSLKFVLTVVSIFFLVDCHDHDDKPIKPSDNIILNNQSLDVIRTNIQGKWKLVEIEGGLCASCGPQIKSNPYIDITGDQIVFGSDLGVTLDTVIVWKKDLDIFNQNTYLLSYRQGTNYPYPIYMIVDRIKNDTLILIDDTTEPFYYNYLKIKQP